jgi:hypothetical protein
MAEREGKDRREHPGPWCVEHHSDLQELKKESRETWVAVRGNGHPENGLVFKVQLLLERQSDIIALLRKLEEAVPKIKDSHEFTSGFKKFLYELLRWAVFGLLVALICLALWAASKGWKP